MPLTQAEYEQLYQQIREDVLKELGQRQSRSHWRELKKRIDDFLTQYFDESQSSKKYKYQQGFYTLIRFIVDVKRIEQITDTHLEAIHAFLDDLLPVIEKHRAP
ncbi:hypothetical protein [Parageobacillus thermoglucosidasius]|uniref:hypothetical protein n=1 Tax=Parageobacillus thermoglucosidasius TaxID=1426 RepID=UPI000E159AD2|nr:hypothetical protein [Parageobacillus thermoglucosidasius]MED4904085.1 hypothetical protein [Parageobacillus thermoglucosidasius]MED4915635.1 hypothetical protein [Parageobacillus thermoglucosidasius]MED4945100.1 hypothetical protein [Parageobacillus thermoglucosidasius]MED4983703.1 hypothetical protein [Parageobacillus thermoglucosidasius]RDE19351.1 hypothetical protein DV714_20185 [Parageobacillus thermoglucosidasius]